jgi:hypothetical protein
MSSQVRLIAQAAAGVIGEEEYVSLHLLGADA